MIPKTIAENVRGAMRGNVLSDIQFSQCVRAFNETENGPNRFEPGALKEYDLKSLRAYASNRHVSAALRFTRSLAPDRKAVIYVWRRHYRKDREDRTTIYGATVTDRDHAILFRSCRLDAVVDACETAARLWPEHARSEYFDANGRYTFAGFEMIRNPEARPDGRAWVYYRPPQAATENYPAGFNVNARQGCATVTVGHYGSALERARAARDEYREAVE